MALSQRGLQIFSRPFLLDEAAEKAAHMMSDVFGYIAKDLGLSSGESFWHSPSMYMVRGPPIALRIVILHP